MRGISPVCTVSRHRRCDVPTGQRNCEEYPRPHPGCRECTSGAFPARRRSARYADRDGRTHRPIHAPYRKSRRNGENPSRGLKSSPRSREYTGRPGKRSRPDKCAGPNISVRPWESHAYAHPSFRFRCCRTICARDPKGRQTLTTEPYTAFTVDVSVVAFYFAEREAAVPLSSKHVDRGGEHVPSTPFRHDQLRHAWVGLQLAAQSQDLNINAAVEHLVVVDVAGGQELLAAQYLLWRAQKGGKQIELPRRQRQQLSGG